MNTPHVHAELIKKWAAGAAIQVKLNDGEWFDCYPSPSWNDWLEYRIKPEVTTSLTNEQLVKQYYELTGYANVDDSALLYAGNTPFGKALRTIADTAIKQYIKEQAK